MKVLVTGGAGFIGSHVIDLLLSSGFEPVIVDDFSSSKMKYLSPKAKLVQMDITSNELEDVFRQDKPLYVFHLAAQVDVSQSTKDPLGDANINILGTIRVLNCCRKYSVKKIIYSSSCAVYGDSGDYSITESFPENPLSPYGISKYVGELYVKTFQKLYGLPYTILRYANVYGPGQDTNGEGGVISTFLDKMMKGERPIIYGDGDQARDFVYVKDIARANVLSLEKGENQIFNIGRNQKTSINQLYQSISSLLAAQTSPIYQNGRKGDIRHSRLDYSKASRILGWVPAYDLSKGLAETLTYNLDKFRRR